jgi:hypothetical protein
MYFAKVDPNSGNADATVGGATSLLRRSMRTSRESFASWVTGVGAFV